MHDLVSSVIIWPQVGQEVEYLALKGFFLTQSSVKIFTAFCGVAVLRMMIPKKHKKNKKIKKTGKNKNKKTGRNF